MDGDHSPSDQVIHKPLRAQALAYPIRSIFFSPQFQPLETGAKAIDGYSEKQYELF
jgi:hypothetical protein